MPGGRPSKPLFELLRDESTGRRTAPIRPSALARPQAMPEAEVKPVPDSLPPPTIDAEQADLPPDRYQSPAPGSRRARFQLTGEVIQISRYAALSACAVVLGAIFLIYVVAYRAGHVKGVKDYSAQYLPPDSPPPSRPLNSANRPSETLGQRETKPAAAPPPPSTPSTPSAEKGRPAPAPRVNPGFDDPTKPILTTTGAFDADPRAPGLNYLVLATRLTREDARQLVAFLGANALETIGVPMETESRAANNPGLYKVVTLKGITSEQFKADDVAKARLTAEGTRLGEVWKDQRKPPIIKDTYWEKLVKP